MAATKDRTVDENRMAELKPVRDWWQTAIIDVKPGNVTLRGYPIEQLIGRVSFIETLWLLVRGELPSAEEGRLLEAAMVASVNGGPMSPSCSIASMAMTCGVGLNNAIASGINALGDTHGGAGQQCMEFFGRVRTLIDSGRDVTTAVTEELELFFTDGEKFMPGFGHRFHDVDPRSTRMIELVRQARDAGTVSGLYLDIAQALTAALRERKGKEIPINVDGAFAIVLAELGFAPPLGRGVFVLARSVGLLAHAWETMQEGRRIKGPVPPQVMYSYVGPNRRNVPTEDV